MTIPVFVGTSKRFSSIERIIEYSIFHNTSSSVVVYFIAPHVEHGCTGFTNVRYAVPQLCREMGYEYGVYLDVDMIVLGDIAELYNYRRPGEWVCMEDGSTEVSVVHRDLLYPVVAKLPSCPKHHFMSYPKTRAIPQEWNVEDRCEPGMKLLHFTSLKTQPWFYNNHPCEEAVAVYRDYWERSLLAQ